MELNKETKKQIENVFYHILKAASSIVVPMIMFFYSSRILGADGVGAVTYARSIMSYFCLLAALGARSYGIREVAKRRDNQEDIRIFCTEMISVNLVSTGIAYLLFACILHTNAIEAHRQLLLVNSPAIILVGMNPEWYYQGLEKYKFISIISMGLQIASLGIMFILVRNRDDIVIYSIVLLIASNGYVAVALIRMTIDLGFRWQRAINIKRHIKPILWMFAFSVSIELYTVLDITMLGVLKGDYEVGLYAVAERICKIPTELISSVGIALAPSIVYLFKKNELETAMRTLNRNYGVIMMMAIPIFIGILTFGDVVIVMMSGREFVEAGITIRVISSIVLFISHAGFIVRQVLLPHNQEKKVLVATVSAAAINITMNYCLIPEYGRNGAAIATVMAELVDALLLTFFARRYFDFREGFLNNAQYWIASIPIAVIAIIFKRLSTNLGVMVFIVLILSISLYGMSLYLLKNEVICNAIMLIRRKNE